MKKLLVICAALAFAALAPPLLAVDHQVSIEIQKNTQASSLPVLPGAETLVATAHTVPSASWGKAALMPPEPMAEAEPQESDKRSKPGGSKRASAEPIAFHRLL